jgi:glycosyltransferase involved in cell wall biosynthesis
VQPQPPQPAAAPTSDAPPRLAPSRASGAVHDLLDEVDVAIVVARQQPWQLAALQAALSADLSRGWNGGALVFLDAATHQTARAARSTLADHHPLARRTVLTATRRIGTGAAANLLLDEATGEYVALLDAATRPEPGALKALTSCLERDHDALWAAPTTPGIAVMRRRGFLDLGGFDPALRGSEAVHDLARRASIEGWNLLTVTNVHAHRDHRSRVGRATRRPRSGTRSELRRPWSGNALHQWLPRARIAVRRDDLA